jgi:N-acetylmuramoyl-L-alanine amidase
MAKRSALMLGLLALGSLLALTGCQQSMGPSAYVEPAFDAPDLALARQAIPEPLPMAVVPPPASVKPRAVRPTSPAFAAVPKTWVPPVQARPWRYIVIHHSDTETGGAAAFDLMHRAKGWDMLGYDFVIGNGTDTADGQVEVGPRWTRQLIGAHAKTPDNRYNEYGVGICLVGNMMHHAPTAKQLAAVERLTAYLMATYHIAPDHIVGHRDTKNTDCPGTYTNLPMIRYAALRQAGGLAAIAATPYRQPTGEMLVQAAARR